MTKTKSSLDFDIKPFNMDMIDDGKKIVFLGKTGSGKSVLIIDYLYHHRTVPIVNVISPTEEMNGTYSPHIPQALIYDTYDESIIDNIIKRQKKLKLQKKQHEKLANFDSRTIIIMDDCLSNSDEWVNDKNMRTIFDAGRHFDITFILAMQYPVGIPPKLRANIQYIFLCRENSIQLQKKYFELYGGLFGTFKLFQSTLLKCTEDRGCLVINNETLSSDLSESVFYYKADIENIPDFHTFKMCYKELWLHSNIIKEYKTKKCMQNINDSESKFNKPAKTYNIIKKDKKNS